MVWAAPNLFGVFIVKPYHSRKYTKTIPYTILFLESLLFSHHTPNKCCYHKIFYYDHVYLPNDYSFSMQQYVPHVSPPTTCGRRHLALGNRRHTPSDWTRWTSNHRCHWKDSFGPMCWHTEHEQVAWQNMMRHVVSWFDSLEKISLGFVLYISLYNLTRWTVSPNSPTNCFNSCPARDIKCVTQTSSLQPVLIWCLPNTGTVGSWDKEDPPTESSEY